MSWEERRIACRCSRQKAHGNKPLSAPAPERLPAFTGCSNAWCCGGEDWGPGSGGATLGWVLGQTYRTRLWGAWGGGDDVPLYRLGDAEDSYALIGF